MSSAVPIFDSPGDLSDLKRAVELLERPSLSMQVANAVGSPIEWSVSKLPKRVKQRIQDAVHAALHTAASAALWTMKDAPGAEASTAWHKLFVAGTGAAGGFFGWPGMIIELPVSTTAMMRSVADIARHEGFSVSELWVQAECIQVFALGGSSSSDDAAESGYYASRSLVAEVAKHTSRELVEIARKRAAQGIKMAFTSREAGNFLARLIDAVASRFGVVITEKMAMQIVPVISAATGAGLNVLFTSHYQKMARGHFIVRRLERKFGEDDVRAAYDVVLRELRLHPPSA